MSCVPPAGLGVCAGETRRARAGALCSAGSKDRWPGILQPLPGPQPGTRPGPGRPRAGGGPGPRRAQARPCLRVGGGTFWASIQSPLPAGRGGGPSQPATQSPLPGGLKGAGWCGCRLRRGMGEGRGVSGAPRDCAPPSPTCPGGGGRTVRWCRTELNGVGRRRCQGRAPGGPQASRLRGRGEEGPPRWGRRAGRSGCGVRSLSLGGLPRGAELALGCGGLGLGLSGAQP